MGEHWTMAVCGEFDVITARMQVRGLARKLGFNLVDQARIALATSSSARALGVDGTRRNQVTITLERLDGDGRAGVRVVCVKGDTALGDLSPGAFSDTRRMVDEMAIEVRPPGGVQVTLIKWHDDENSRALDLNRARQLARA
jgi:anti-sigma regulatory factor (Ser/Thr protein kinase)